ncbi:MAG TPA: hypothetical protein VEC57_15645 [Candidatus Limnocylindrales bacterium]|nr:hypothetical protein [Candidatus Limnocylindrales bacterium]
MNERQRLMEKLRRIEALCARPGTEGERLAAARARERILARLAQGTRSGDGSGYDGTFGSGPRSRNGDSRREDTPIEMRFRVTNEWSRRLLLALLQRHGIRPYRRPGQRHTTVMARMPGRFAYDVFWPQFEELDRRLQEQFHTVTDGFVAEVAREAPRKAYGG